MLKVFESINSLQCSAHGKCRALSYTLFKYKIYSVKTLQKSEMLDISSHKLDKMKLLVVSFILFYYYPSKHFQLV